MYNLEKELSNGLNVHIELGVIRSKNPDHVANIHLFIEGFGHVRGIMAYLKHRDGKSEWVLRLPSYKSADGKSETAYLNLDDELGEAIVEALEKTPKDQYAQYYTGPKKWDMWHVQAVKVNNNIQTTARVLHEMDVVPEEIFMADPDEGDR